MDQGGNYWTLFPPGIWKLLHAVFQSRAAGPTTTSELTPVSPRVGLFQDWLRRHRGISERTIDRYGRMVMRLLAALGADPAGYVASLIRQAILDEVKDMSAAHAKTITTALRCYLRFLGASGECRPDLIHAVPTIPQWRLSAMPRYLPLDDVERLIASCDTSLAHGVRDKAILLLLSRLGLRAGDVLALRLDHLCWADGTLRGFCCNVWPSVASHLQDGIGWPVRLQPRTVRQ